MLRFDPRPTKYDLFFLSHPILVLLIELTQLPIELDIDFEIQIALIPGVWLHPEVSVDLLASLARDVILQIEDGLFPVGVGRFGGS